MRVLRKTIVIIVIIVRLPIIELDNSVDREHHHSPVILNVCPCSLQKCINVSGPFPFGLCDESIEFLIFLIKIFM